VVAVLLIIQPDLGMLITVTGIWGVQLFIAGLPFLWIILAVIALVCGLFAAYSFLPHVADRINSFLNPSDHENYQVSKSLLAFEEGGIFGRGPGEGIVKQVLPDSHTDFIFAVAGEEFGAAVCILISLIFCYIVVRGILKLSKESNNFVLFASSGILGQIGLQSAINMGVSLNLLPTKGMTLPFISYGGSSTLSISIAMGMLLAFSKTSSNTNQYKLLRVKL